MISRKATDKENIKTCRATFNFIEKQYCANICEIEICRAEFLLIYVI